MTSNEPEAPPDSETRPLLAQRDGGSMRPPEAKHQTTDLAPLRGQVAQWIADVAAAQRELERGDPEGIHDFRVSLRKLRSVTKTVLGAWDKRKVENLAERLRRVAQVTGDLRDEEVLRETLTELELDEETRAALGRWMRGRARRERGAKGRVVRELTASSSLTKVLSKLSTLIEGPPRKKRSETELARRALGRCFRALQNRSSLALEGGRDAEAMHRARIAAKKLRYTANLLRSAGHQGLEEIESSATLLQKRLGRLQDLRECKVRMQRALGLAPEARGQVLVALKKETDVAWKRARRGLGKALEAIAPLVAQLLEQMESPSSGPFEERGDPLPDSDT